MKILMHYADTGHNEKRKRENTYGGIGYYRTVKPASCIKSHEVTVMGREIMNFGTSIEDQWDKIFQEYDVFWTSYFTDDKAAAAMFYMAKKHGKKVIIDVDDNFFDIPESNLVYNKFKKGKRDRAILSTILYFADAISVSTQPLKERIEKHFRDVDGTEKKVFIVPNMNEAKDWDFKPDPVDPDVVRIGYMGSNSHHDDFHLVFPAIVEVMKRNPNVLFETLGVVGKNDFKKYYDSAPKDVIDRMGLIGATETFKEFPEWLSQQKWDIGIAPLVDTAFTRSKSHIKWMEYSMFEIPTVASRVYPYFMDIGTRQTIDDGETGFLCNASQWVDTLDMLVKDADLRKRVGRQAREAVLRDWQYEGSDIDEQVDIVLKGLFSS